jgi:hypothetical protein
MVEQNDKQTETMLNGWVIAARIIWMAIRIVAIVWVGQYGAHFLYQGF